MLAEVHQLQALAVGEIQTAARPQELVELRIRHLGRRSRLRTIMSELGTLPPAERPALGQAAGAAQKAILKALEQRQNELQDRTLADAIDVTLPGRLPRQGKLHPLTLLGEELTGIFRDMGFELAEGPEIEDEYHNFDALNTPADHPARDLGIPGDEKNANRIDHESVPARCLRRG